MRNPLSCLTLTRNTMETTMSGGNKDRLISLVEHNSTFCTLLLRKTLTIHFPKTRAWHCAVGGVTKCVMLADPLPMQLPATSWGKQWKMVQLLGPLPSLWEMQMKPRSLALCTHLGTESAMEDSLSLPLLYSSSLYNSNIQINK